MIPTCPFEKMNHKVFSYQILIRKPNKPWRNSILRNCVAFKDME